MAHAQSLPELTNPGLTFSLGALAGEYVLNRKAAAYLPARYVKRYIDTGQMHLVPNAPRVPYPVWAVWREDLDPEILAPAKATLTAIAQDAESMGADVIEALADLSEDHQVDILGKTLDN